MNTSKTLLKKIKDKSLSTENKENEEHNQSGLIQQLDLLEKENEKLLLEKAEMMKKIKNEEKEKEILWDRIEKFEE